MNRRRRILPFMLACAAFVALSCSDIAEPGRTSAPIPQNGALFDELLRPTGLLSCTPLAPESSAQSIGPAGGTIVIGPHRLFVPAGALGATVTITATIASEPVNRVHFEPAGLQFERSAWLSMSYAHCNIIARLLPKRIAHVSSALEILSFLPSLDNLFSQTVHTRLDHFSDYAVAW